MNLPVTPQDFIEIGKRYATAAEIEEADRLIPLIAADIQHLSANGYNQGMLDQLKALRAQSSSTQAVKAQTRGTKRGARMSEEDAKEAAKNILRSGIALAQVAIANRPVPAGESQAETCEVVSNISGQLKALGGGITNHDSARLRSKLETLKNIMLMPQLAPIPEDQEMRTQFLDRLDQTHDTLIALSTDKKQSQDESKQKTLQAFEVNGRLYHNLRLASQIGRATFRELNQPDRASFYVLHGLHAHGSKQNASSTVLASV